jgi:hypothetical protein
MTATKTLLFVVFVVPLAALNADPQHQHADMPEQLGSVHFQTSCDSRVQGTFERGVALLHSFWYEERKRRFRASAPGMVAVVLMLAARRVAAVNGDFHGVLPFQPS